MMLRKYVYPEVVYGEDARSMIGQYVQNIGLRKPLVVTDEGLVEAGWLKDLIERLHDDGISYEVFKDVVINPTGENVTDGVRLYRDAGCDGIIALGGGSPIDCAKGIGILAKNQGSIFAYNGVDKISHPGPPLISLPTTAGSAADVSQFAIIRDTQEKVKFAIISKMLVSDVSLVDSKYLLTLDEENTIHTGIDALSHAIEALLSTGSSELTDMHAAKAIELVRDNLHLCLQHPGNLVYRDNLHFASMLAGFAFSNASLGVIHAISHGMGGYTNLSHGFVNAALLMSAVRFNYEMNDSFIRLSRSLGAKDASRDGIIDALENLLVGVGFRRQSMQGLDIDEDALERIASASLHDPCILTNPTHVTKEDIQKIIRESFSDHGNG